MKNTPFEAWGNLRLPREIQLRRVKAVVENELTELQRQTVLAYYFQKQSITEIARDRGVNKSTVCRTLHRAEERLRKYLTY